VEWVCASSAGSRSTGARTAEVARSFAAKGWKLLQVSNNCYSFDVLVVGGGPAGMAAAVSAAESGLRVGVADDNLSLGGQIWRGEESSPSTPLAKLWYTRCEAVQVDRLGGCRVFGSIDEKTLLAETIDGWAELKFDKLILATGARERFLPFPGWTLPNVMGAGGLQALVKSGVSVAGRKVVIAGTGPLLLAVAAHLKRFDADIRLIAEQASWSKLLEFGLCLISQPSKLKQAIDLRADLRGVRFVTNCWPIAAEGGNKVESVTMRAGPKTWSIGCDYLACGFHLVPNVELAIFLGCALSGDFVQVDHLQRTSATDIFCAGEPTGIGGLELSLVEGQIAGYAAAGASQRATQLFPERDALRGFAGHLNRAFGLRPGLRSLATPETLVCRCEDVEFARLREHKSWRSAKLHTRCGMGPCQGRICGPALEFLLGWKVESIRPPVFPVQVETLAASQQVQQ